LAFGLRDPGYGKLDADKIKDAVRGAPRTALPATEFRLRFFEIVRRLLLIATIRRVLFAQAVLGMLLVPLNTYFVFFLQERWGLGAEERALFFAAVPVIAVLVILLLSRFGESLFRRDPARLFRLGAAMQGTGIALLALSIWVPNFWLMFLVFGLASGTFFALTPALATGYLSIVRPHMRPHASALAGIFSAGVGGFAGLALLSGMDRRYGVRGALLSVLVPGLISALVMRSAASTVNADLDRLVDELVEEEELGELATRGVHLPLLACRNIDFSYGQLQVLFGVDFTVDDGELVAILGTNGAGKSTLLRVISGLGLPLRGSVRYRGGDITFLDAERRVRLGISQIPGGRAVFGTLSVIDNLRAFGYAHRHGDARSDDFDQTFQLFPQLELRRNQAASTLSGGEQQMLGLARALIVKPRLLLIDELSLGLAPKAVTELLAAVRGINAAGTAVVLVEQSVNLALSLVHRAYFMEKGEVRFEGNATDLLARGDLLRSVFLEGAAQGLKAQ
jgi:ABC-type branched-subunit amino acid transport system ATPase component